ncbi:MAG: PIG-L family deacetylase [Salibacteraceae bacterium]|jgi:LmbE family N-acetylglucosaminyl deacetylase|nr:PIG-L family deacetylase [Salibacteraceae bacterium]MDP4763379.1 PIG-L family deacetylase [Salibacteraceae bacterium]MDP4844242.1 PIG-L family deacetylase [Salibacteraceae bacterium]
MRTLLVFISALIFTSHISAQDYELKSTPAIYHDLQELTTGIRVLYIAAHPDDENTRLISWLENNQHVRTAYLSLTRGQGGQNLIGDEKGDALGLIRTYELLEARKIDGGEQFFTRAIDFGYSKSAEESFEKWDRDEVMSDVVYVIRKYRPHVIITRFPPSRAAGHGHHEASAILAREAFDLAADPNQFPEQLDKVAPWQAQTLFHNHSTWWDKTLDSASVAELEEKKIVKVDIGVFNDITGLGINEIASLARSKHRCQAFGTPRDRGSVYEYLELIRGDWTNSVFNSVKGVWSTSPKYREALETVVENFDFRSRYPNYLLLTEKMEMLLSQRNMWANAGDIAYVKSAYDEIKKQLSGVRLEVYAGKEPIIAGEPYEVTVEAYNSSIDRATVSARLAQDKSVVFELGPNEKQKKTETLMAPMALSNPYWLRKPHENLYVLENPNYLGLPNAEENMVEASIGLENGSPQYVKTSIHRKWNDRSYGEFMQPLQVFPKAHINPSVKALIVPEGTSKKLEVKVIAQADITDFTWILEPTNGWDVSQPAGLVSLKKGQEANFTFEFKASKGASKSIVNLSLVNENTTLDQELISISYDHIPEQVIQTRNQLSLIPISTAEVSGKVLYIEGSGDEVDDALVLIGYEIDKTPLAELSLEKMKEYKAVITGIRAFNTSTEVKTYHQLLMDYVKVGGNMIVQYNTTYDLEIEQIGPYSFSLSRNRVTEENSEVTLLDKKHAIFKTPNKITDADWQNWVQERGLYFAGEWDENYKPLIAWHDKGEEDQKGGLIACNYGEGSFFYTGISFFRQLPAGVPGAYRLLVNMIEYQP